VSVAGKAIGVWSSENADFAQLVPCSFLTANPVLFMEPTHASLIPGQSVVELGDSDFTVILSDHLILKTVKVFTQDGFFRSATIR